MNKIHKIIGNKAVAIFESEPSPELIDVITKMVEIAYNLSFELKFTDGKTVVSNSCPNCGSSNVDTEMMHNNVCNKCTHIWSKIKHND